MKNNKEKDSSSLNSSTKTNSSSKNEDIFAKQRPRGGIKSKINNFQPGRHTIAVPLNSFNGIIRETEEQGNTIYKIPLPEDFYIERKRG